MLRHEERLNGVDEGLASVVRLAAQWYTDGDLVVLEGLRTKERQAQLVKAGASWTMNSRHLTGHAVDVAPMLDGEVSWHWPHYHVLARYMRAAAIELGVTLEWGGDWVKTPDGPHWQIPRWEVTA